MTERPDDLLALAAAVEDSASLLAFIDALVADRVRAVALEKQSASSPYGPDRGGWENVAIESYLESAAAWARSTGFGRTQGVANPWQAFATFLYLGKIWE